MEKNKIFCVGDSHVSVFSGVDLIQQCWPEKSLNYYPFFESVRLGPVLAYNLLKLGTKTKGRENLFGFLSERNKFEKILLSFGEIDCRAHLVKQAHLQGRTLESVVTECVDRYFDVICEVKNLNFDVMVWNVNPSTISDLIPDTKDPVFGSYLERTEATKLFNEYLSSLCFKRNIRFLSIFDRLVDINGDVNLNYYLDEIHLSQKAMPLILDETSRKIPELDFHTSLMYKSKRIILIFIRRILSKIQRMFNISEFISSA